MTCFWDKSTVRKIVGTNLTSIVAIKSKAGGSLTPSLPSIPKITVLLKGERAMAVKVSQEHQFPPSSNIQFTGQLGGNPI